MPISNEELVERFRSFIERPQADTEDHLNTAHVGAVENGGMSVFELVVALLKFPPSATAMCPNDKGDFKVIESIVMDDDYNDVLITSRMRD